MERLTKTYKDNTYGVADNLPCGENSYAFKNLLIERLGEYENAEEQGLLLKIPCRCKDCTHVNYEGCAGTTCYCMKNGCFMQNDDFCIYAEQKLKETTS